MKKSIIISVLAIVLCFCAMGTTLAFLMDTSDTVVNTFTFGDINIELTEETGPEYKVVPGATVTKDPIVTVIADSEACYLFVKVVESDNFDDFMTYAIATGWTALAGNSGVYYREVENATEDQEFQVLANNQVTVNSDITKDDLKDLTENPTLTFTAYAVQRVGFETPAEAWAIVPNP